MSDGSVIQVPIPFAGCEWRDAEAAEKPGTCTLAINATFARGVMEARRGSEAFGIAASTGRLHGVSWAQPEPLVLCASVLGSGDGLYWWTRKLSGEFVNSTTLVPGRSRARHRDPLRVSFVDYFLPLEPVTNQTAQVVLIVSRLGVMAWVPQNLTVAAYTPAANSFQRLINNYSYWDEAPACDIAVEHDGRVWYAGFPAQTRVKMTHAIPAGDGSADELLDAARGIITFGEQHLWYSDGADPLGIQGGSWLRVPGNEPITALASFQEELLVFTPRDIFVVTGGGESAYAGLRKIVSGVGCVSHWSLAEAGGALYFLGQSGVYAYTSEGLKEVTAGVRALWDGNHPVDAVPQDDWLARMAGTNWPWVVSVDACATASALLVERERQVWFSLPLVGGSPEPFRLVLAVNYEHGDAVSFHVPEVGLQTGLMTCGCNVRVGNRVETILQVPWRWDLAGSADFVGYTFRYGVSDNDFTNGQEVFSEEGCMPLMYLSSRMGGGDYKEWRMRPLRFQVKGGFHDLDGTILKSFIMGEEAQWEHSVSEDDLLLHPLSGASIADGDESLLHIMRPTEYADAVVKDASVSGLDEVWVAIDGDRGLLYGGGVAFGAVLEIPLLDGDDVEIDALLLYGEDPGWGSSQQLVFGESALLEARVGVGSATPLRVETREGNTLWLDWHGPIAAGTPVFGDPTDVDGLYLQANFTVSGNKNLWVVQAPASGIKVMGTDATTNLVMSGGDWFSSEVNAHVTSRSYRFGFIDYGRVGGDGQIVRPPQTVVQMMAVWQNHGKRG